jgi:DEAD/DEAH box helicase domain-containing protein
MSTYREPVSEWLRSAPRVPQIVRGLTAFTGLSDGAVAGLEPWARERLVSEIDAAVASPHFTQHELSERLSNAGVLPMFGFPTRVRSLYHRAPRSLRDDADAQVSDRALDIAVSSFSPGSEVPRDKALHVCVGFAAWEFRGNRPNPVDPLGQPLEIRRCPACGAVEVGPSADGAPCSLCQSRTREFLLYQPLGFRTDFDARDYDDQSERGPAGSMPELAWTPEEPQPVQMAALSATVLAGASVFTINDNDGELFDMYRFDRTVVVPNPALYADPPHLPGDRFERQPDAQGAIGSVKPTDVLILNPDRLDIAGPLPMVTSDQAAMPAGIPALWSFAELFRVAAALELDVGPNELEIGLQPVPVEQGLARRIFIADALENGAGYATHLGQPEVLQRVLDRILGEVGPKLEAGRHADDCTASCPDCLRSYDNRRLHTFLDWRLGLDLAELAAGTPMRAERWLARGERLARGFARAFDVETMPVADLWAAIDPTTRRLAFFGHPLWRLDEAYYVPEQAEAYDAAMREHAPTEVKAFDLFTLTRWPQNVFAWLIRQ